MKIGLAAGLMEDNDLDHQVAQIKRYLSTCSGLDLLCFGESFLQGFEGLTWDYEKDLKRALAPDSSTVLDLKTLAKNHSCGLSFGFIERAGPVLYSSNMVINSQGKIINVYRRATPGWKEPDVSAEYQEGFGNFTFNYLGKRFATAICGDLWDDALLKKYEEMSLDVFLWPVYLDFSVQEWHENHLLEYVERVQNLSGPVLLVNSFVNDPQRANGGCYVFDKGEIIASLPVGNKGVLEFVLK